MNAAENVAMICFRKQLYVVLIHKCMLHFWADSERQLRALSFILHKIKQFLCRVCSSLGRYRIDVHGIINRHKINGRSYYKFSTKAPFLLTNTLCSMK